MPSLSLIVLAFPVLKERDAREGSSLHNVCPESLLWSSERGARGELMCSL